MLHLWREHLSTSCICQTGSLLVLVMNSGGLWRNLMYEQIMGSKYESAWLLFKEPPKGRWYGLNHQRWIWRAPSRMLLGSELQNTPCDDSFCSYLFFQGLYPVLFSIWKSKENLFDDSIPNWGSHWSYVFAWMNVYEIMRECVVCRRVRKLVALTLLVFCQISFFFSPDAP